MHGIDTNILVRYLVMDDPKQSKIATHFIQKKCTINNPGFISITVLIETVWVFENFYNYNRDSIGTALDNLLRAKQILVEKDELVWQALDSYLSGFDFPDAIIGLVNENLRCKTTYTFDKKASKLDAFTLLK